MEKIGPDIPVALVRQYDYRYVNSQLAFEVASYLQRGVWHWHLREPEDAATDFLRSSVLFPNDERMASAGVLRLLLNEDVDGALAPGKKAYERFPDSLAVWEAYANARTVDG